MIQDCPARMYNIAPIFCPSLSWLHGCYSSEFSHRPRVVVGLAQWGTCTRTIFHVIGTHALAYWNNNLATVGPTKNDITILDAFTGSQTAVLSGHAGQINSLTYSSEGTFLVSGVSDNTIKLWDVQTGGIIKTLCGHTGWVYSVSVSADDRVVASASVDKTIRLWNIKTENCCIIRRHVHTVTFSPTNPQLLFSFSNDAAQQWNIDGHEIGSPVPCNYIGFSQDSAHFVSWEWEHIIIQSADSKRTVIEYNLPSNPYCYCFSPSGRFIAVAIQQAIYLWDITGPGPCLIQTLTGHSSYITSLVFSSPYHLISASSDQSIKFWQIGAPSTNPSAPSIESTSTTSTPIKSVSLQANDGLAFSINSEGVVKTWDILTGYCKESYRTQIRRIRNADIQLISDRLIIVWEELFQQKINVWDAEKGELQTIGISDGEIQGLRIIGDGSRVVQLSEGTVQLWDIWTGRSMCKEGLEGPGGNFIQAHTYFDSLRMDGSKVLVHFDTLRIDGSTGLVDSTWLSVQGWDFGTPDSAPIQFSETSSGRPHLKLIDNRRWLQDGVRIEDGAAGKEIFQLCGRYANPSAIQWDGQYLIAGYDSGEVFIFDFNSVLS